MFEKIAQSRSNLDGTDYFVVATEFINERPVTSPSELLAFSTSLITAVQTLHDKGSILHCDLKPDNIRWNGCRVALIDFGSGQYIANAVWTPGTEGFEAPEILQRESCSTKSDAFSVGKVIQCFGRDLLQRSDNRNLLNDVKYVAEHLCVENPDLRWSLQQGFDALEARSALKRKESPMDNGSGQPFPNEKLPKYVPSI